MNRHPDVLNRAICPVVPDFSGSEGAITWVSPLEDDRCREYRDVAALKKLGLGALEGKLREFWPLGGPQWDALGTVQMRNGRRGVLLVEAKSHVDELGSAGTAAKDSGSIRQIRRSFEEAKVTLSVRPDADWLGQYYQSANRLAHLYFFRTRANVPAWLINVFFLNDPAEVRKTTRATWEAKIVEVRGELGYARVRFLMFTRSSWSRSRTRGPSSDAHDGAAPASGKAAAIMCSI